MIVRKGTRLKVYKCGVTQANSKRPSMTYFDTAEKWYNNVRVFVKNPNIRLSEGDEVVVEDIIAFSRNAKSSRNRMFINNSVLCEISFYKAYFDESNFEDIEIFNNDVADKNVEIINGYEIGV